MVRCPTRPKNLECYLIFNVDSPIYTTYSPGLSDAELAVPAVTPMAITNVNIPSNENSNPRLRLELTNKEIKHKQFYMNNDVLPQGSTISYKI